MGSLLARIKNGVEARARRYLTVDNLVPRPLLKRTFDAEIRKTSRKKKHALPSLRREIAEAALGEALTLSIDPSKIVGFVKPTIEIDGAETETKAWFLLPGTWDFQPPPPLPSHPSFRRMADLLSGVPIEQCATYKELRDSREKGGLPERVAKLGGVDAYFDYYRTLAEKIRATGEMPDFGAKDKDP